MRVMIVEDQTMIRSLLESYFRVEDGYRITASIPGAKQAVEVCRTRRSQARTRTSSTMTTSTTRMPLYNLWSRCPEVQ